MNNILDKIIENKFVELQEMESFDSLIAKIEDLSYSEVLPKTKGFLQVILDAKGPALIAEIKKASPSKGLIRASFDALEIAAAYDAGGAHCFSVLTDNKFFQGSYENLISVSSEFKQPCLCKEFIIDPKQIAQARLAGADAILLIAAILDDEQLYSFREVAYGLEMDVLLEVHAHEEMERALTLDFELIGINNRDLKTFEVSLDTTSKIINDFKYDLSGVTLVSESGISTRKDIMILHSMGVQGFLVGEALMRQEDLKMAVMQLLGD
jgi:indole-3-glycerol phosphate synthase